MGSSPNNRVEFLTSVYCHADHGEEACIITWKNKKQTYTLCCNDVKIKDICTSYDHSNFQSKFYSESN